MIWFAYREDYNERGMLIGEFQNYDSAVEVIKTAILQSQYDAARSVNEKQLMLYYGIGKFILTFGKDFAFVRNQYHLDAFGEDQYIDLLFFNRALNCLVAVKLKNGKNPLICSWTLFCEQAANSANLSQDQNTSPPPFSQSART